MNAIQIYEMLTELIAEKATVMRISEAELNKYYIPEGIWLKQNRLVRLASSLQNSGMMHNSIRFNESDERFEHIKSVLCNFDCNEALSKYGNWRELYDALTQNGKLDNGTSKAKQKEKTNWIKYAKGLFCGMEFLANENGEKVIDALCENPTSAEELDKKIKALKRVEKRIHGLGFALTCDWLKECGCNWLAKPDVHIKIVCSAIEGRSDTDIMSDVDVIKYMFNLSEAVKEKYPDATAYKLDKIIWLICTGNFYLQKDKIGRDKILSLLRDNKSK